MGSGHTGQAGGRGQPVGEGPENCPMRRRRALAFAVAAFYSLGIHRYSKLVRGRGRAGGRVRAGGRGHFRSSTMCDFWNRLAKEMDARRHSGGTCHEMRVANAPFLSESVGRRARAARMAKSGFPFGFVRCRRRSCLLARKRTGERQRMPNAMLVPSVLASNARFPVRHSLFSQSSAPQLRQCGAKVIERSAVFLFG